MDAVTWYQVATVVATHLDDPYLEALTALTTRATATEPSARDKVILEIMHHVAKNEEYSFFKDIAYVDLAYRRIVRVYAAESETNTILLWDDSWADATEFDSYKDFYEHLQSIKSQLLLDR